MQKITLTVISIVFIAFLSGTPGTKYAQKDNKPMKNYNNKDVKFYQQQWKKIDSLKNLGLYKTCYEEAEKIYAKAKADNNLDQQIKALLFSIEYLHVEDPSQNPQIVKYEKLKKEINNAGLVERALLHSIMAEHLLKFYNTNRWEFSHRTKAADIIEEDITTWDLKTISEKISGHYLESIKPVEKLKKTFLDTNFKHAVLPTKNRNLRSTLFDFLAHRAVDFFSKKEYELSQPIEPFVMDDKRFLSHYKDFVKFKIATPDNSNKTYNAIGILQQLIRFHQNDNDPSALMDVDIKRLNFVLENCVIENKNEIYRQTLSTYETFYANKPVMTQATYWIAKNIFERGKKYNRKISEKYKWDHKTALKKCKQAIDRFPDSYGAKLCQNLKANIENKSIRVIAENVNIPQQSFLVKINYRNIGKVHLKIFKVHRKTFQEIRELVDKCYKENNNYHTCNYDKFFLNYFTKKDPVQTSTYTLPGKEDYREHSTEIIVPGLDLGQYVIIASISPNIQYEENATGYVRTHISNLSFIKRDIKNNHEIYVLDRITGKPLPNVTIDFKFEKKYNPNTRKHSYQTKTVLTDNNGYASIPIRNRNNYEIIVKKSNDVLDLNHHMWSYYHKKRPHRHIKTVFFSDRKIYRPGQTVYFKGIMYNTDRKRFNKIAINKTTEVTFTDVNRQLIAKKTFTTNAFGTFNGSFVIPQGLLNGMMMISNKTGAININVEAYKRPKFEVNFDRIKGKYRLGEKVNIKGTANAFSGAKIDNAQVKYSVVRKAVFPWWCYFRWRFIPTSPEAEITHGTTITDENGIFKLSFIAKPDLLVDKNTEPQFTYTIHVDITDINGETRSKEQYVTIGYKSLLIDLKVSENVDKNTTPGFEIKTTNLNGEPEATQLNIIVYRMIAPNIIYRTRLWDLPDKYIESNSDFTRQIKDIPYDHKNQFFDWKRDRQMLTETMNTGNTTLLEIKDLKQWESGVYVCFATGKDQYGEPIKEEKYFTLYSPDDKNVPYPQMDRFVVLAKDVDVGETAKILVGTSAQNINALFEIEQDGELISKQRIKLSNNQQIIEIPIKNTYRGNISVKYIFVKNNRIYNHNETINIPYSNLDLNVSFETFRDKLKPGQKEEWRLKIKGNKGNQVAAEVLATMYDASLDAFTVNDFYFNIKCFFDPKLIWNSENNFMKSNLSRTIYNKFNKHIPLLIRNYDYLYDIYRPHVFGAVTKAYFASPDMKHKRRMYHKHEKEQAKKMMMVSDKDIMYYDAVPLVSKSKAQKGKISPKQQKDIDISGIQIRKNFDETAFFYPELKTNEAGDVLIGFTVPEALTKWKLLGFAHTKELEYSLFEKFATTSKELMIIPEIPRFLRQGDKMTLSAKVNNMTENAITGNAQLKLFEANSMQAVDADFENNNNIKSFAVPKGQSALVSWNINIPDNINIVSYRIVAKSDNFSDGEENILPVLTNRMLVTESLPLWTRGKQTKTFRLNKLIKPPSATLKHEKIILEYTSNPTWYAIQALPYLMEYPYDCTEQIFSRLYANSIAMHIMNSNPKIKQVFDQWKNVKTSKALLTNLEKNQELKSLLLYETPWVLNAQDETERKKRIALLFDLNRMSRELGKTVKKLYKLQNADGSWSWFEGLPASRYITQHIITGLAKLEHLGVKTYKYKMVEEMLKKGIAFLDKEIVNEYKQLKNIIYRQLEQEKVKDISRKLEEELQKHHLSYIAMHYLYARSFMIDKRPVPKKTQDVINYYLRQERKYWMEYVKNFYAQGMIAISLYRFGYPDVPSKIVNSLKEQKKETEELGAYWAVGRGYFWYQAPIETQVMLIEVFNEIVNDKNIVNAAKTWLIKQKNIQDWRTTKATTEACYALLMTGDDWLSYDKKVSVKVGKKPVDPTHIPELKTEVGTGYFQTSWKAEEITEDMGKVTVTSSMNSPTWGSLYWQYFENLEKITPHKTPLKLEKKLFVEKNTGTGKTLIPVDKSTLKIGDKVVVRIIIKTDRTMEYIHLKDMRAACFEPINVMSAYKYQDGLWYYESTKDASTHFFIENLRVGTYVFEYPLGVTTKGVFSNGITTIQSMYAPEFTSHSEGVRVFVE